MDERQRQFAQFASALNQFAAGNSQGTVDRSHRERSTNDGRSSTGSTSSGSSSIVSNNGNNVAAAVAAVAGGNAAVWGELNRAMQYGYPPFAPGGAWPASQGPPPDFHRLGANFGNYGGGGNNGRTSDRRSEGRRVPSKGETKATPPLPPGLAPTRGSTLASLQQLVNLPNEEVYRLIAAQQYAAAFSVLPTSSRAQLSPGPNPSHTSISPGQIHPNSDRHQNLDHSNQYNQLYIPQQRYRQSVRNISPLSSASSTADRQQASPSPDNVSINGDYSEPVRREDMLSALKHKDVIPHGQIRVSPNLMPTKVTHANEGLCNDMAPYSYDSERQSSSNSRVSDGQPSGSDSEGDQKSRHRRKQHQPKRQSVIYGSALQPQQDPQQLAPSSAELSSDDSQDCNMLIEPGIVNHSDIPPEINPSDHPNPLGSMSSAMSHALSHPFLAPHLNQSDRKFENTDMDLIINAEKKVVKTDSDNTSPIVKEGSIKIATDLMPITEKSSSIRIPDLIPCNPNNSELDSLNSDESGTHRTKKVNCVSSEYSTPVKKRKLSQPSVDQNKDAKSENYETCAEMNDLKMSNIISISCDSKQNKDISKTESLDSQNIIAKSDEILESPDHKMEESLRRSRDCKLVNGDHDVKDDLLSPTKLSDLSDDYYDCGKRRMRQKRPISYVEDETDPVQETNEDIRPLMSPTRRRGRRSKDKSDSTLSPEPLNFPSITIRDASLYDQADSEFGGGGKLLRNIPEKVKEPLHIDTGVPQGSLPCSNEFLGMQSPDIYDFNDTDGECPERTQKKRGRKRGSPRKSSHAEFTRSSPRNKDSICSPKFFPSIRSLELVESKSDHSECENQRNYQMDDSNNYRNPSPITKVDINRVPTEVTQEVNQTSVEQHNNNYAKRIYEPYTTISPTKLASLCQEPVEAYTPTSLHNNGPYRNEFEQCYDTDNDVHITCNNNRVKNRFKKRKRGRPKGSKSSPKKDILECLDPLMIDPKDPLCNIPVTEQTVNISVAQFPSPSSGGRGRRKKRGKFSMKSPPLMNDKPRSPLKDKIKNESGRNTQNSVSSPDKITPTFPFKMETDIKNKKNELVKQECEGETMEDIEQFLKETAPSTEITPVKSGTSDSTINSNTNTSDINTPSTSENAYRDSRPKRVARPPPEMCESEMKDLMLLLNMDGEESDDEDYVPKENDENGSDSRLSLTDIEYDSDASTRSSLLNGTIDNEQENEVKIEKKVVTVKKKKKTAKKVELPKKRDDLKKKVEDKTERRGPYVRLREKGGNDLVVNTNRDDDEKDKSIRKQSIPFHVEGEVKNVKVGFNSTLHPNYNAFTKDMNWFCAFCKVYSHHCTMGDLFGPYFINSSPSKKNFPTVTEGQVEESISSPEEAATRFQIRRTIRGDGQDIESRKSEVWESPPMRFVPSATPARMLGRGGLMRTPERGNIGSPRLIPGSPASSLGQKLAQKSFKDPANTPETPLTSKRPPGTECWLHASCLLWASGVTVVNSKLLGMDDAVISAQDSVCSHCKESGATVCCLHRGCPLTVHVPCARFLHWSLNNELFLSHCPLHVPSKDK